MPAAEEAEPSATAAAQPSAAADGTEHDVDDLDDVHRTLVKGAFALIGLDYDDYRQCYNACVDKCGGTGVLTATVWSKWGCYKGFKEKIEKVAQLTEQTGNYHIMDAPTVLCAIMVRKLRLIKPEKDDTASPMILKYKAFVFAHASVMNWKPNDHKVRPTNQVYKVIQQSGPASVNLTDTESDDSVEVDMSVPNQADVLLRCQAKPREPPPGPIFKKVPRHIDRVTAMATITNELRKTIKVNASTLGKSID
ncbi:hypothetical protein BBK36DRAFT_692 [Trichoderma citrinoviride]|uniref:Uncharacterized protein n=1 Tax=Trichoderma citrinoviride TaxID=58853 RepID=A0A2T4BNG4_9HYPO|nr:hypothetical protein BBK36DRAFT_692 [Trichoderma citrinoviride]PTB70830.1 hypothetical protein BBK36DRAFT_692 [Trichoderma citrinoviride]